MTGFTENVMMNHRKERYIRCGEVLGDLMNHFYTLDCFLRKNKQ